MAFKLFFFWGIIHKNPRFSLYSHTFGPYIKIYNVKQSIFVFVSADKLYVVMELIEGAPLAEHFSSLKEKQQTFTEERVWNIFIQVRSSTLKQNKENMNKSEISSYWNLHRSVWLWDTYTMRNGSSTEISHPIISCSEREIKSLLVS